MATRRHPPIRCSRPIRPSRRRSAVTDLENSLKGLGDRAATAKDKLGNALEDAKSAEK